MSATTVLLVATAALAATGPTAANLAPGGPYTLTVDHIGQCDDGEYPAQIINITQVWDEKTQKTAFKGYINRSYDDLADDCQMEFTAYKWGSTGGWSKFYDLTFQKPFDFVMANFPEVYEYIFRPLGYIKKPVPPGVYYINEYMGLPVTLKSFAMLPYGKYKVYAKASKGGERPSCFQMSAIVSEVGVGQALVSESPLLGAIPVTVHNTQYHFEDI